MLQWLQPDTRTFCVWEAIVKCCHCTGLIPIYKHSTVHGKRGWVRVVREVVRTADEHRRVADS